MYWLFAQTRTNNGLSSFTTRNRTSHQHLKQTKTVLGTNRVGQNISIFIIQNKFAAHLAHRQSFNALHAIFCAKLPVILGEIVFLSLQLPKLIAAFISTVTALSNAEKTLAKWIHSNGNDALRLIESVEMFMSYSKTERISELVVVLHSMYYKILIDFFDFRLDRWCATGKWQRAAKCAPFIAGLVAIYSSSNFQLVLK